MTMPPATLDRTYWHVPGARSWHALIRHSRHGVHVAFCGRSDFVHRLDQTEQSDRVPSNGHLCGSCARVIAARTDIE